MSRTQHLRYRDLRDVYTTVHECLELGADPVLGRGHFLRKTQQALGARIALHSKHPLDPTDTETGRSAGVEVGWGLRGDREMFMAYLAEGGMDRDPLGKGLSPTLRVSRRQEILSDREWYASPVVNDYYRPGGVDHAMTAMQLVEHGRCREVTNVLRPRGDRAFTRRDRRRFALTWVALKRELRAGRLANFGQPDPSPLPPRTLAVLDGLLQGDSEKQVARRLGMSPHTVRDHVKRLHRELRVQSRGELVSRYGRLAGRLDDAASPVHPTRQTRGYPRRGHRSYVFER